MSEAGPGAFGHPATRLEHSPGEGRGQFVYGSYSGIDALFPHEDLARKNG